MLEDIGVASLGGFLPQGRHEAAFVFVPERGARLLLDRRHKLTELAVLLGRMRHELQLVARVELDNVARLPTAREQSLQPVIGEDALDEILAELRVVQASVFFDRQMREAFEQQKIMAAIATGVWSTGVSFDGLQCLGRIDGGSSETNSVQMPGRVGRLHPESGKDCGIMFDMNDMFDAGFRTNTTSRRRMYESRKWTQITNAGHVMSTNGKRRRR